MGTLTSSSSTPKTSFDFMKNNTHTNTLSGPFPSYLSSKEGGLMPHAAVMDSLNVISNGVNTPKISKQAQEDAEIGVFGAEKYFNGDMDSDNSPRLVSLANSEVYSQHRSERNVLDSKLSAKKSTGTASIRSESSWNSQIGLLRNRYGKNPSCSSLHDKKNCPKVSKRNTFMANLWRRCACSNGNSVDVEENSSMKITSDPVFLVQEAASRKVTELSFSANLNSDIIQRKSLEVFGSPILEKRSLQKKLAALPWDSSSTRTQELGYSVKHLEEGETGSDASSDLFEIRSPKGKQKPFLARQGSDPASPTCYAPSEVSVEWSVVTASAADFSVMSECATSPIRNRPLQIPRVPITRPKQETTQRRKSSSGVLLLGCKSHKSVRISGDSYRTMNTTTPSYVPRFPTEATRRMSGGSISRSQSPRTASHLLYI